MAGAKLSTSPLGKVIDVQDIHKSVLTGLHIENQVGKPITTLVCPQGNKCSLGVKLREMHGSNTEEAMAMPKNSTV